MCCVYRKLYFISHTKHSLRTSFICADIYATTRVPCAATRLQPFSLEEHILGRVLLDWIFPIENLWEGKMRNVYTPRKTVFARIDIMWKIQIYIHAFYMYRIPMSLHYVYIICVCTNRLHARNINETLLLTKDTPFFNSNVWRNFFVYIHILCVKSKNLCVWSMPPTDFIVKNFQKVRYISVYSQRVIIIQLKGSWMCRAASNAHYLWLTQCEVGFGGAEFLRILRAKQLNLMDFHHIAVVCDDMCAYIRILIYLNFVLIYLNCVKDGTNAIT